MLAWATMHWPGPAPKYMTLVGDGHWNLKNYRPDKWGLPPNWIPPYLAWADPWQGEVPADALYGDITGDLVPDIAVGRLPVNTLDEANTVVDKIIAYDEAFATADWQRRTLLVADDADSGGDFAALSDEILQEHLPADLAPARIYLKITHPDAASTRAALNDALNAGVLLAQYTGHGAIDRWAGEGIWRTSDVVGLHNDQRLPVVMTFACLDGYFVTPNVDSMAETMLRRVGGGSIAAISPGGLSLSADQRELRIILLDTIFKGGVRSIGEALTVAKQAYAATNGSIYLIQTQTLFGDPAMLLPFLPSGVRHLNYLPQVHGGR